MSIEKFIVLTIVTGFVSFVSVENHTVYRRQLDENAANNFTLDQFLGIWYEIAVIYPLDEVPHLKCDWFHITHDRVNDQGFYEVYKKHDDVKGVIDIYGYGNVFNSELRVTFLDFTKHVQAFAVMGFDSGENLILIHKTDKIYSGLISKSKTASLEARAEFERLAGEAGGQAIYFDHRNCTIH